MHGNPLVDLSPALLAKIGSIVGHVQELRSPSGDVYPAMRKIGYGWAIENGFAVKLGRGGNSILLFYITTKGLEALREAGR